MATLSKGKTFGATEQVTNTKLHALIDDGSISGIVNADIDGSAGIVDTKLATISTAGKVEAGAITDEALDVAAITCDSVSSAGAISGTTIGSDMITVTANNGIILTEGTAPSTPASTGVLYTKDTSGQPELFFREESDGDEVQLTSGGSPAGGSATTDYVIKGWSSVTYSGGTPTLQDSYNVSGITDTTTGQLQVSWDTDFASTNYCPIPTNRQVNATAQLRSNIDSVAVGSCVINTTNHLGTLLDPLAIYCMAIGAQ